jgi:Rad/Gem-related GTP binding protein 1
MLVEAGMDEFDEFRARAYTHQPLTYSNSLPGTPRNHPQQYQTPQHQHQQHPSISRREADEVATRLGHVRVSASEQQQDVFTDAVHHNRSLSCRSRAPRRPRDLELKSLVRRRTYSMPTKNRYRKPSSESGCDSTQSSRHSSQGDDDDDLVRVRTFSTSARGIINRGDSFKRRSGVLQPPSMESVQLQQQATGEEDVQRERTWSNTSQGSSAGSAASSCGTPPVHRVVVMGARGVGKTSIIQQFMTSEYMGNADASLGEFPV